MLVRISFTITMAIFGIALICFFMFGCSVSPPLYVIDVQKLAGAEPKAADQLLQKMVPCELRHEDRWEEGQGDVENIIGKLHNRMYEIENGQINKWERKPMVKLFFDADYEEQVNGVTIHFIEYVEEIAALHQLGYSPEDRIKHRYSPNAWHFITQEYLHQVYLQDAGESTAVTIHLDALTH